MIYLLTVLTAAVGCFIQRVSGFGFGIFAMMLLPYIAGSYGEANALSGLLSFISCAIIAISMRRLVGWKNIITPLCGCMVFSFLAVRFMTTQQDTILRIMLGVALILLSLYFVFFSSKVHIKATWWAGLIAGCLSGVLSGLFAMGGPPLVVYFMETEKDPKRYLATIQMYFVITNIYNTGIKALNGLVTQRVLLLWLVGSGGLAIGLLAGRFVYNRLNAGTLKKIVYGMMAVSGAVNIVTALI